MEVTEKYIYPQSVDTVFKAFGAKEILDGKFAAAGCRNVEFEKRKLTRSALELKVHREVPVEAPSLLKRFLGEWNAATLEEHWRGTPGERYEGELKVAMKGVAVSVAGRMVLTATAKGCTHEITLTVESGIPLIGRKLAEFVGEAARKELQKEYAYLKPAIALLKTGK